MRQGRVEHIYVKELGDGYEKSLCGRIVQRRFAHFGGLYGTKDYFRHNSPDCQECLKKHFAKKARKNHGHDGV